MAAKIFNNLRRKYKERRAYNGAMNALAKAIATGGITEVVPLFTKVSASPLFDGMSAERLLEAAFRRDDAEIFYAVLPGKDPNREITLIGGGYVRTEPLLSAAILQGSPNIASALAADSATNILKRGKKTLSSLLATPVTIGSDTAEILARKAGLDDIATTLRRRHAALLARPLPPPAKRHAS